MYLGIDVGGTHTDGALLDDNFGLLKSAKVPTRPNEVLTSLLAALEPLLADIRPDQVERLVVSSTLGLNAVLTGRADPVGVLATGGPGLDPDLSSFPLAVLLPGAQDHRGAELEPLEPEAARRAAADLAGRGALAFAVISKFGPKNSRLEDGLARAVALAVPGAPVSRASRLAGRLNFPRRLNTAYLNSSVTRLYGRFIADLKAALAHLGLRAPVSLLTADGGALSLAEAAERPASALAAGPAAGLLGLWSLTRPTGDALMLDVGGTSTDLAVMADGEPLMTAEGLDIAGRPTLVRAFLSHSLALGGDSALSLGPDGSVGVGPKREGPALALDPDDLGRRAPTLTDALNVLDLSAVGETEVSRLALARFYGRSRPEAAAARALSTALAAIREAVFALLQVVGNRPVYTLGAVRLARPFRPTGAALLGGPAPALAGPLARALGLPVSVAPEAAVANAIGAASSRPSARAELYADTALGTMSIPGLGLSRAIGPGYHLAEAENELLAALRAAVAGQALAGPPQIVEAESFNQLGGYGRAGRIFRLVAQTAPGVMGS